MKKIYILSIFPFIIGLNCFIAFAIIGSHVAPDGTLIEPFALLPIGFFFLALSLIISLAIFIRSLFNKKQKQNLK